MPNDHTRARVLDLVEAVRERPTEHPVAALTALAEEPVRVTVDRSRGETVVFVEPRPGARLTGLTAREREVAELVADGLTNVQVARGLGIEVGTVKDHVHAILRKTGLPGRAAVAAAWHGSG